MMMIYDDLCIFLVVYSPIWRYRGFHSHGVPQNGCFISKGKYQLKWMSWGYHHLWKPPDVKSMIVVVTYRFRQIHILQYSSFLVNICGSGTTMLLCLLCLLAAPHALARYRPTKCTGVGREAQITIPSGASI